nr:hypothetical protein [Myxococcus fulvus]
MICPVCARLRDGASGESCQECGNALVPVTEPHFEALVKTTLWRHIASWRDGALIDESTALRLEGTLTSVIAEPAVVTAPEVVPVAPPLDPAARVEAWANGVAASVRGAEGWTWGWAGALARSLDNAAKEEREQAARRRHGDRDASEDDLGSALGSGQSLFAREASGALGGGLEAMVALDAEPASSARLHDFIWWFLGAVLVLGGSLMGVREAWQALGGVPRQLLVTGALWGYHAAFIGLGVFLSRRSLPVGRVLSGIGLALLPVAFIAMSSLVGLSMAVGIPVALGVTAIGLVPLRTAGRLLYGTSASSLALALVPSLLAGLPLMGLDDAPWARVLCASVGVVALGATLWRGRAAKDASTVLVSACAALYGALWLAVFAVASAPSGFDAMEPGGALFAGMTLWTQGLATVLALAATTEFARGTHPRLSAVVETVAHAVLSAGALAGALGAFTLGAGDDLQVAATSALAPVVAAGVFFLLESRRRALVHPAVMATLLSGVLVARVVAPTDAGWWVFGGAVAASGLMFASRRFAAAMLSIKLLTWSLVATVASMPLVARFEGESTPWPRVLTGLCIALVAHVTGGWRWRALHYLGGIAALFGALAFVDGTPALTGEWSRLAVFALLATLYGVVGHVQLAWAKPAAPRDALLPLDDLSMVLASACVVLSVAVSPVVPELLSGLPGTAWLALPTAWASAGLLLRARRDETRLVTILAALGVSLVVSQVLGTTWDFQSARAALVAASVAFGFAVFAALRPREPVVTDGTPPVRGFWGRKAFDLVPLPLGARGLSLYTDGFATVALAQVIIATLTLTHWLTLPSDAERALCLLAGGMLAAVALLAFVSRGFVDWQLRGTVVALAAMGGFIALTAIINRAGRPLPPDIVAMRHPLVGIALWGIALATRRFGPWVAARLEKPSHGPHYHLVPHAGVLALVFVLIKGAVLVGLPDPSRALGIIPPLMVLGAAMLMLLLARSFRSVPLANVGLYLGIPGAALWAARQSLLGPSLVSLAPPDGQWVRAGAEGYHWLQEGAWLASGDTLFLLWQRAFVGIAAVGLVYAAASIRGLPESFRHLLHRRAVTTVVLVSLAALFQPGLMAAGLVFATGVVLFVGGARTKGRGVLGASVLLLVHAAAHRVPILEAWPGPLLALVGLLVMTVGPWVVARRGLPEGPARIRIQQAMVVYLVAGGLYALAVNGDTSPTFAALNLLGEVLIGLGGTWMVSPAFAVTLALSSAAVMVAALRWKGAFASLVAAVATGMMGATVVASVMTFFTIRASLSGPWLRYDDLFSVHGAALALAAAGAVVAMQAAQRWSRTRRADIAGGMTWGRDGWLVTSGLMLALFAVVGQPSDEALRLAIAAIGLSVLVALHCAWVEHTGRHVYFVQLAVVGVYAMVRALYASGLRAEHDALFALALGFVLVGVTVMARRAGVKPVEAATRRFAALLPLGMAMVLPGEATREAALLAGGSGLLYAALGAVERSRMFGAFAAAACNLALLIAALAFGLEGLEIYLAPLGLLLLMLGQLFTESLPHAARNTVRILGGLLLYVPAASKLAMSVGQSPDGTYALVFGGVCLLGVVVGMALQIRAYLALGTLFLTLDVVANLLDAGLRDHRIGFLVMTLAGLTLIGGRILTTMKRQEWELLVRKVRVELRGWD